MNCNLENRIRLAAEALKSCGAREVYVFGSACSENMRPDSDVDLAVAGLPPEEFFTAMSQASDVLGRDIQLDLVDLDTPNLFTEYLKSKGKLQLVG